MNLYKAPKRLRRNQSIVMSLKNRFYSKVLIPNEHGCMEWTGKSVTFGYGMICINHSMIRAHRYSYELHNGKIPKNMHVLHSCDNRLCVAPHHLFLGSNKDNILDRVKKGRSYHPKTGVGSKNFNSSLTESEVLEIRKLLSQGMTKAALGRKFNVTQENIAYIEKRITWKHI